MDPSVILSLQKVLLYRGTEPKKTLRTEYRTEPNFYLGPHPYSEEAIGTKKKRAVAGAAAC
jgi:hypothetical protein